MAKAQTDAERAVLIAERKLLLATCYRKVDGKLKLKPLKIKRKRYDNEDEDEEDVPSTSKLKITELKRVVEDAKRTARLETRNSKKTV